MGARGCSLPPKLPPVYAAALSLILEHGWDCLHGGENSGPAWTALHWAALQGRDDVCEVLLQAGADPFHMDEMGKTPLDYALLKDQHAVAAMLRLAQYSGGRRADRRVGMLVGTSPRAIRAGGQPMAAANNGVLCQEQLCEEQRV